MNRKEKCNITFLNLLFKLYDKTQAIPPRREFHYVIRKCKKYDEINEQQLALSILKQNWKKFYPNDDKFDDIK